jgi:hypothetical protein
MLNLLKMKRNLLLYGISPYRAVNTFYHGYKTQTVNDVYNKSSCFSEIGSKLSTKSEHHVDFFYIKPSGKSRDR